MLLKLLKILSFLVIFNSFSFATDMYYDYCIENYYFKDGSFHVDKSDGSSYDYSSFYAYRFDTGYEYNSTTGECRKKPILKELQITNEMYHFLIGLVGVLTGFIFLFFGIYIAVDVAKK